MDSSLEHETSTAEPSAEKSIMLKNDMDNEDATNKKTTFPAAAGSRFFSRIGSIGDNATANMILSRAQRLRDQAVYEVDRLRHQQQTNDTQLATEKDTNAESVKDDQQEESNNNEDESAKSNDESTHKHEDRIIGSPKRSNAFANETTNKHNMSSLRNSFNVVRTTGTDAKNLIFFPSAFGLRGEDDCGNLNSPNDKTEDDGDYDQGSESLASNFSPAVESVNSSLPLSPVSTPVKNLLNANGEFRTVGRYSKGNETSLNLITAHDPKEAVQMISQQHGSTPTEKRRWAKQMSASPVVGGADRVVGLRFVNWEKVVGPLNDKKEVSSNSFLPTSTMDKSLHSSSEPTVTTKNDDDTATVSTNVDVTDTGSTITGATASEETKSFRSNTPAIPKSVKDRTLTAVSYYEDVVRSTLKPGQRAMFFGQGVLGIVMKPTYLASWRGVDGQNLLSATTSKKGGVYIDSIVRGSQAYLSRVVHIGDHIVKVGTVDVSCMTLEEVVDVIADAKRPNIIILTSAHEIELISTTGDENDASEMRFTSLLDLVYGYVNKIATEGENSLALFDYGEDEISKGNIEEEVLFGAETAGEEDDANEAGMKREGNKSKSNAAPVETVSESSTDDAIDTLSFYASRRTNGHSIVPQAAQKLPVILERVALSNPDFRNALRFSLVECCSDPRRTKFLKRFFSRFELRKEAAEKKRNEKGFQSISNALRRGNSDKTISSSHIQQQLLELYLELLQFHDATLICPESDRERLLIRAKDIFQRFLDFDGMYNDSALPKFVVDAALGGSEQVLVVRRAIEDEDHFFECQDGNAFSSIRASLEAFLSLQESYLGFLISDDCARMRAYLRGSAPFIQVEPMVFLTSGAGANAPSQNFLLHAILHLVSMKEADKNDDIDCVKNDAIMLNNGDRNMGAVSLLSCAIFIARTLEISSKAVVEGLIEDGMTGEISNAPLYSKLIDDFQYLWDVFLAPAGGSLSLSSLSKDVQDSLNSVRRLLVSSVDQVSEKNESLESSDVTVARALTSVELTSSVHCLKDALFREYALNIYPIFRRHIFHEWACQEAKQNRFDKNTSSNDKYSIAASYNGMKKGSIKRLLRQVELPKGVSLHRPSPKISADQAENQNAASSVALIFGTDSSAKTDSGTCSLKIGGDDAVRRFAAVSLQSGEASKCGLMPKCIPPVFESYAIAPPFHERPFLGGIVTDEKSDRITADGWEVSLTNFVLPSGSSGLDDNEWMYCVSLVFRKPRVSVQSKHSRKFFSEHEIEIECVQKLVSGEAFSSSIPDKNVVFRSPIVDADSNDGLSRKMIVPSEPLEFNRKLQEQHWSQSFESSSDVVVGLAVVSDRNQTFRMRETLSLVYRDFCRRNICQPLVDILGNFSNSCVEESCLNSILEPYLSYTGTKWVDNPIGDQELYSEISGAQLMQSLPPVPLALLFITCLLEQKIVLASSRRGMLMAASKALMQLLKPLQWKHLMVPLVPESMMDDLVHYPAPFLLGIPTDERKSAEVLSSLPENVTLVDLDVGRVMLASEFVCDGASESKEGGVIGALRSQVLFLAESLGGIIGRAVDDSWASDSPLHIIPHENGNRVKNFVFISSICHDVVAELLAGVESCCLWIEERHDEEPSNKSEPAIVFDEERFLSIKHLRAEGLNSSLFQEKQEDGSGAAFCLGTDEFGLILDTFLRTQSLSTYISHGEKESMMFW